MQKLVSCPVIRPGYGLHRNDPTRFYHTQQPNFTVQLVATPRHWKLSRDQLNNLIVNLTFSPDNSSVFENENSTSFVLGTLSYVEWNHALDVMVKLWELRLSGRHCYNVSVKAKNVVLSDKDELNERSLQSKLLGLSKNVAAPAPDPLIFWTSVSNIDCNTFC
ncbi:hypothetical protein T459_29382 [Capsicum annuum]|uniref:Uncharacterized protein n=1 Tax=Capsicum annuum TaxID=4072 RepID=A0A2G2Y5B4_CAPAN|nr:hypothetical protein T459_29382 [Capsicum annuum]